MTAKRSGAGEGRAINFDAKTFHHHYYTRQIKVLPFVTIGTEVEH